MSSAEKLSDGRALRLGVAGLGRAFTLMLPTLTGDPRVKLVAAADPRPEARERFAAEFGSKTYTDVEALCADSDVEVVYIATPHQHHATHVRIAARHGKHVLVEKPIAITLSEADDMIAVTQAANVHLVVGHSHSFDAPILKTRALLETGTYGPVRMIAALNYTDFLYRPRRPEELDTARGGGALFSQGAHQIDIVRLLGGGLVKAVRAQTGAWDKERPTEGAFTAMLTFDNGAMASLTYNGYGHFDSDEFTGWIGEMGQVKEPHAPRKPPQFDNAEAEAAAKNARNYGGANYRPPATTPAYHQHFGLVLVSCERGDLRPVPNGVMIYRNGEMRLEELPAPTVPRAEVVDELYAAVVHGRAPLHDGRWAKATLEVCLAMLRSARSGADIPLSHQVAVP